MPLLKLAQAHIRRKIIDERANPLQGLRLAACLHVSKETSVLLFTLKSFGVEIRLVAANPLSTQDDIASFLSSIGVEVRANSQESVAEYLGEIKKAALVHPDMVVDDGGELHVAYSKTSSSSCFGGTDETTSGTRRLMALEKSGNLRYPVITVNEAVTKHLFDNKYGTGQSSLDGLLRATGLLIAGKIVVVNGYGWVGKGVALRSRGMGARVIVTEVDPVKAIEAHLDGFQVLQMKQAAKEGEIFLTCTGQTNVLSSSHFDLMKDGAVLGNCGHFDKEIDLGALRKLAKSIKRRRKNITEFSVRGKKIYLLTEGRVLNLVAAEGHPPEVMQLSFANQLLSLYYLAKNKKRLATASQKVIPVPREIDVLVADLALRAFGLKIDKFNKEQRNYESSFIR
jgi:adenosylhomocysteinase